MADELQSSRLNMLDVASYQKMNSLRIFILSKIWCRRIKADDAYERMNLPTSWKLAFRKHFNLLRDTCRQHFLIFIFRSVYETTRLDGATLISPAIQMYERDNGIFFQQIQSNDAETKSLTLGKVKGVLLDKCSVVNM